MSLEPISSASTAQKRISDVQFVDLRYSLLTDGSNPPSSSSDSQLKKNQFQWLDVLILYLLLFIIKYPSGTRRSKSFFQDHRRADCVGVHHFCSIGHCGIHSDDVNVWWSNRAGSFCAVRLSSDCRAYPVVHLLFLTLWLSVVFRSGIFAQSQIHWPFVIVKGLALVSPILA